MFNNTLQCPLNLITSVEMFVKLDQNFLAYQTSPENLKLMHEFVEFMRKQVQGMIGL